MGPEKFFLILFAGCILFGLVLYVGDRVLPPPSQAAAQTVQAQGWQSGPGGVNWIDMGDGTRCYRGYASSPLSCVRMQP